MDNYDVLILDVCYNYLQKGEYSIGLHELSDSMIIQTTMSLQVIQERIESLWEHNYLSSINGKYCLTDKSLSFLKEVKGLTHLQK